MKYFLKASEEVLSTDVTSFTLTMTFFHIWWLPKSLQGSSFERSSFASQGQQFLSQLKLMDERPLVASFLIALFISFGSDSISSRVLCYNYLFNVRCLAISGKSHLQFEMFLSAHYHAQRAITIIRIPLVYFW